VADRYSPLKAIGWSIAFVVLVLVLTGLLAFGVALVLSGSAGGATQWLTGSGPAPVVLPGSAGAGPVSPSG
jgi:hypothetical protein